MVEQAHKPPVVFLHGWTMEGCIFDGLTRRLKAQYDCQSPDLPGHGISSKFGDLSINAMADYIAAYLNEHNLNRPVLVGWSLGAMVAWNLVRRYPEIEIAGIASIDMSPKTLNDESWRLGIFNLDAKANLKVLEAVELDWLAYTQRINTNTFARGGTPQQATLEIMQRQDPALMAATWRSLTEADERQTIANLSCPMVVMAGQKSRVYPEETAHFLQSSAPDAKLVVFENSGHAPHLEEPERFAEELDSWLSEIFVQS